MKLRELFEARVPTDAEINAAHGQELDPGDHQMSPYSGRMSGPASTPFTVYQAISAVLGHEDVTYDEDDLTEENHLNMVYVYEGSRNGYYIATDDGTGGSIEVHDLDSKAAADVAVGVHEACHALVHRKTGGEGRLSSQETIVNNMAERWIRKHLHGMAQHVALETITGSRINYGPNYMPNPSPSDLRELFDPNDAYNVAWAHDQARFKTADGREIRISFHDQNLSTTSLVEITFSARVNDPMAGKSGTMGITGGGDAARILNTVVQAALDWFSQNTPEYVMFTADEPSRQKLYAHMVRRLSRSYHRVSPAEYQQIGNDELPEPNHHVFLLKRNPA